MKIAIVSTGTELLRGVIADTNGAWLASKLDVAGFSVERVVVVDDDLKKMTETFKDLFSTHDLVIVGGGLGPTEDDRTAAAAAGAISKPLKRNEIAASQIRRRFDQLGLEMPELNLKQADLPEGCAVLSNDRGTAPGFAVDTPGGRAVFLPGVSSELKPMFQAHVLDTLLSPSVPKRRLVMRCFGRGESDVQSAVMPVVREFPDVSWSFRATFPELVLTLSAPSEQVLEHVKKRTVEILGPAVFATEDKDLAAALGQALIERSLTLAVAESCTGGQIGHRMTETAGSSAYFRGGVIAYDNDVKADVLGVPRALLETEGAVSRDVVIAMAQGARRLLGTDVAVAVSGIAGPDGGSEDKPVGLVHFAVAHPEGMRHRKKIFSGYHRSRVKRISTWSAMWFALRAIRETEWKPSDAF